MTGTFQIDALPRMQPRKRYDCQGYSSVDNPIGRIYSERSKNLGTSLKWTIWKFPVASGFSTVWTRFSDPAKLPASTESCSTSPLKGGFGIVTPALRDASMSTSFDALFPVVSSAKDPFPEEFSKTGKPSVRPRTDSEKNPGKNVPIRNMETVMIPSAVEILRPVRAPPSSGEPTTSAPVSGS